MIPPLSPIAVRAAARVSGRSSPKARALELAGRYTAAPSLGVTLVKEFEQAARWRRLARIALIGWAATLASALVLAVLAIRGACL